MKLPRPLTELEITDRFPDVTQMQVEMKALGLEVTITLWEEDNEEWEYNPAKQNAKIDRAMERAIEHSQLDQEAKAYLDLLNVKYPKAWDELASIAYSSGPVAMVWAFRALIAVKKRL